VAITAAAFWVLPLLLLQMLFAFAVACLTSAAHVNFRDIGHGLPLMLQLWMFASPVAYPISVIPSWLLPFYLLNPMAPIIDGYRQAILHGSAPDLLAIGLSASCVLLFAMFALSVFRRAESTFADVI
jgi:ABC-type polysaccharide/polyol phosphate export permease